MEPILLGLSLIDLSLVGGVAVVLPAALGGRWRVWGVAAASVALACSRDQGAVAVLLGLPWAAVGVGAVVRVLRAAGPLMFWTRDDVVRALAGGYGLVAATWLLLSRGGASPMGIREPIVQLTSVHFTYAAVGGVVLAGAARRAAQGTIAQRVGGAAVLLTAGAPPIVALGFVTGAPIPQVGGAVLLTVGVWCTAWLQLVESVRRRGATVSRVLLIVSGGTVVAPMVLAVAWAAGQHWDVPALSVPDMVRTHGAGNALGFILCGLLARQIDRRHETAWS